MIKGLLIVASRLTYYQDTVWIVSRHEFFIEKTYWYRHVYCMDETQHHSVHVWPLIAGQQ